MDWGQVGRVSPGELLQAPLPFCVWLVDVDLHLQHEFSEVDHDWSKVRVVDVVATSKGVPLRVLGCALAADFGHYAGMRAACHLCERVRQRVSKRPEARPGEDGVPEAPFAVRECHNDLVLLH